MNVSFAKSSGKRAGVMMNSMSEVSGSNKSEWEQGVAVIQDILRPGTAAYEALTPDQRHGLENVQKALLGAGGFDEAASHLPMELRRSAAGAGSSVNSYLLSQFAGMQTTSAKQRFKSVVNANKFITGLRILTGGDRDSTTQTKHLLWSYLPPEWDDLDKDAQRQVSQMLAYESLSDWGFDVFKLDELTNGNALLFVGFAVLSSPYSQYAMEQSLAGDTELLINKDDLPGYRFLKEFDISPKTMANFLRTIQQDYVNENAYHNSIHAADVTQSVHSLLTMGGEEFSNGEIQVFAVLLSAVIHDVGHPGKNNSFQIQDKSEIALQYNDQSVLENMHLSKAFMRVFGNGGNPNINIFKNMKPKQFSSIRSMVIEAVLHTDMTKHFASVNLLKGLMISNTRDELIGTDHSWSILQFVLHLADISNPAKPNSNFEKWTDRCLDEFFQQGDEEKKRGLPVSPLCDRDSTERAESQIGFIEYVVMPAFRVMAKFIPRVEDVILPIIEDNLDFWILEADRKAAKADELEEEKELKPISTDDEEEL
eukprot:scaffold4829_cov129-Cylindrotheca_fusiformis.AAC.12